MRLKTKGSTIGGHWRRVIVGVLAVVILLPVPALAFTFLGSTWTFSNTRTGGAPGALRVSTDNATRTAGVLQVDMRAYTARRAATSVATLTRSIRITAASELISITNGFAATLRNANANYRIQIQGTSPRRALQTLDTIAPTATTQRTYDITSRVSQRFARGTYRITVRIAFSKTASGLWNNTLQPQVGSPFRLTFGA